MLFVRLNICHDVFIFIKGYFVYLSEIKKIFALLCRIDTFDSKVQGTNTADVSCVGCRQIARCVLPILITLAPKLCTRYLS